MNDGAITAVELVHDGSAPVSEPEQLDLLGLPVGVAANGEVLRKAGPGRPAGSRNKRTEAWAEFLLSRYASPLEVLAQIATERVDVLAASLGCGKLEALQEKRHAAIALAPYLHQRQAVAVDVSGVQPIELHLHRGGVTATGGVVGRIVEVLTNQELSEGDPDAV